jgi:hypothetical protein
MVWGDEFPLVYPVTRESQGRPFEEALALFPPPAIPLLCCAGGHSTRHKVMNTFPVVVRREDSHSKIAHFSCVEYNYFMAEKPKGAWRSGPHRLGPDRHKSRREKHAFTIFFTDDELEAVTARTKQDGITKQEAGRKLLLNYAKRGFTPS